MPDFGTQSLPSLFISHGAPTFATSTDRAAKQLAELGRGLRRPNAILVVSAHWLSAGLEVSANPAPESIHDFSGFPEHLYSLRYPAPGSPELAHRVINLLADAGFPARENASRGLDHGAWVPLLHLVPAADIPVVQLSIPLTASPEVLWTIGGALETLRHEGCLLLGSGGLTHNLSDLGRSEDAPSAYVTEFANWIADAIENTDRAALVNYRQRAPMASRAHPTDEHLRPIFFALGAAGEDWSKACRIEGGVDYGVLSMDSYAFGVSPVLLDKMRVCSVQAGGTI